MSTRSSIICVGDDDASILQPVLTRSRGLYDDDDMENNMDNTIAAEQVRHIALLSRISVDEEQLGTLSRELGGILSFFDKLQELDTSEVVPMAHAVEIRNVFGDDVPGISLTPQQALANAPARDGYYFQVPKVIADS